MEFLHSNFPPVQTGNKTFLDQFLRLFGLSTQIDISVGYITTDSIAELKGLIERNENKRLNLTIGMHYFDKFTKSEYNAALMLNSFLKNNALGSVHLVRAFRYHGKLYTYSNRIGPFAGIIGSNNLSSIVGTVNRVYESSVYIDDSNLAKQMLDFQKKLTNCAAMPIDEIEINSFRSTRPVLAGQEHVASATDYEVKECQSLRTDVSFELPLKPFEQSSKSNLNVYFGKGRENKSTGIVRPRPWYEVEIIVPKEITVLPCYPKADTSEAVFDVITDDGWRFKCNVSGENSKNFRSNYSLEILGKWIKGRMEADDSLKTGTPLTQECLDRYGRSTITFTKTSKPNLWYLDFGVKK